MILIFGRCWLNWLICSSKLYWLLMMRKIFLFCCVVCCVVMVIGYWLWIVVKLVLNCWLWMRWMLFFWISVCWVWWVLSFCVGLRCCICRWCVWCYWVILNFSWLLMLLMKVLFINFWLSCGMMNCFVLILRKFFGIREWLMKIGVWVLKFRWLMSNWVWLMFGCCKCWLRRNGVLSVMKLFLILCRKYCNVFFFWCLVLILKRWWYLLILKLRNCWVVVDYWLVLRWLIVFLSCCWICCRGLMVIGWIGLVVCWFCVFCIDGWGCGMLEVVCWLFFWLGWYFEFVLFVGLYWFGVLRSEMDIFVWNDCYMIGELIVDIEY